jgi:DNA sulfur modification protein DndD
LTLDKLIVENFGIYLGRHIIELTPPSRKKTIVLFGGLNGAGKTTLLDALQLALHGKRARCSNRGAGSYEEYLRASVNRFADPGGGASVEVHFHTIHDGRIQSYRIRRSWYVNGSGVKETVDVYVDGVHDPAISDAWAEYAEEFIPAKLSHLFFFDGEKIEALANLENASEVLRSGIHSLLGLDVVDRLHADLDVVASRKNKQLKIDRHSAVVIATAETEVSSHLSRRDELLQNLASLQGQTEQTQYRQQKIADRLQSEGGDLFRQKDVLMAQKVRLEAELSAIEEALRDDATGIAPLLILREMLDAVDAQARRERLAISAQLLGGVLKERDDALLQSMKAGGAKTPLINAVSDHLERDRRSRTTAAKAPRYLSLTEEAQALLQELRSAGFSTLYVQIVRHLTRRLELAEELTIVERKLSMVPDEDAVAPFERERKELEEKRAILTRDTVRYQEELRLLNNDINRREAALFRLREESIRNHIEQEDVTRVTDHSRRAQVALKTFREKVVEQHIVTIQAYVLQSFQHLLRKNSLVSSITIDSRTFALELRGGDGEMLMPDRLSAGERQLLAVSLLWGLAKASRRPLPAIIDTPLGRLDSSHRQNLVERYFPYASHQVLLLSTDEEIRGDYLAAIQPWVGHSYLLAFDERQRSSIVTRGYFGQEDGRAN